VEFSPKKILTLSSFRVIPNKKCRHLRNKDRGLLEVLLENIKPEKDFDVVLPPFLSLSIDLADLILFGVWKEDCLASDVSLLKVSCFFSKILIFFLSVMVRILLIS